MGDFQDQEDPLGILGDKKKPKKQEDPLGILKKKEDGWDWGGSKVGSAVGSVIQSGLEPPLSLEGVRKTIAVLPKTKDEPEEEIDTNDPIGDFGRKLLSKTVKFTASGKESTGQKSLSAANQIEVDKDWDEKNKDRVLPHVAKDIYDETIRQTIPDTRTARKWLSNKATPDPNNETDRIALQKVQEYDGLKQLIVKNNFDFTKTAVDFFSDKDDQLKLLKDKGVEPPDNVKANLLHQFLQLPVLDEMRGESQEFNSMVQSQRANFYQSHPEQRAQLIVQKIAQGREDYGYNNPFFNLGQSKETADKVVDNLVMRGEMSPFDKDFYEKNVRDLIGIGAIKVPTTGLIENTVEGAVTGMADIPKGVYELTGARELMTTPQERAFKSLAEDANYIDVKAKGLPNKISQATGHLAGVLFPMAATGKLIRGLNIVKDPNKASQLAMGIQFYHGLQKEAEKQMPDNQMLAHLSALTGSVIFAKINKVLPAFAKGIAKETQPAVKEILGKLQTGAISGAAAKQELTNTVIGKLKNAALKSGKVAGNTLKLATEMSLATGINDGITGILSGKYDADQSMQNVKHTFESMLLGGGLLSVMHSTGKKATADYINEIGNNAEFYKKEITKLAETDTEFSAKAPEILKNLEHLIAVREVLGGRKDLSEDQKKQYQVLALNEAILQQKKKSTPTKPLQDAVDKEIAENEIAQKRVLDPEMGNKEFVEEMYNEGLLPKGSMEMLEVEGKFSEHKVGEYLKFIAQQANNLDENWKPIDGKPPSMSEIPAQIVEAANERWKDKLPKEKKEEPIDEVPDLSNAVQMKTRNDVERAQGRGDRMFVVTEADELPMEVKDISVLNNYTPDQIYAIPQQKPKAEQVSIEDKGEDIVITEDNYHEYIDHLRDGGTLKPSDLIDLRKILRTAHAKEQSKLFDEVTKEGLDVDEAYVYSKNKNSRGAKLHKKQLEESRLVNDQPNAFGLEGDVDAESAFHFTDPDSLLGILSENKIWGEGETSGVSTTTNRAFDHPELTQAQAYGEGNKPHTFAEKGIRIDLDLPKIKRDGIKIRKGNEDIGTFVGEEELRIGNWKGIDNASDYIKQIQVDRKIVDDGAFNSIKEAASKLGIRVVEKTDYSRPRNKKQPTPTEQKPKEEQVSVEDKSVLEDEYGEDVYWHGSDKNIEGQPRVGRSDSIIKTKMGGIPFKDLWDAFYVTNDKGWAEFFSPNRKRVHGVRLKKNAKILDLSGVAAESTHLKNKAFLGGQNIKSDFLFQKDFDDYAFDWLNKERVKNGKSPFTKEEFKNKDLENSFRPTHKNWFLDDLGAQAFADYAKERGYDAVKFGREIAILNPDVSKFVSEEKQSTEQKPVAEQVTTKAEIDKLPEADREIAIDDLIYGRGDEKMSPDTDVTDPKTAEIIEPFKGADSTVDDVLGHIISQNSKYANLAKQILETADADSLKVKVEFGHTRPGKRSFYSTKSDKVLMDASSSRDSTVIMHEIIHAVTSKKLPTNLKNPSYGNRYGKAYLKELNDYLKNSPDNNVKSLIKLYIKSVNELGYSKQIFEGVEQVKEFRQDISESKNQDGSTKRFSMYFQPGELSEANRVKNAIKNVVGVENIDVWTSGRGYGYQLDITGDGVNKFRNSEFYKERIQKYTHPTPKEEIQPQLSFSYKEKGKATAGNADLTAQKGAPYGLGNLDEFLAEAFTSKSFQEKLSKIKYESGKSVWQRFVDTIKELLGIEIEGSVLSSVIKVGADIIATKRNDAIRRLDELSSSPRKVAIDVAIKRMKDAGFTDSEIKTEFEKRGIEFAEQPVEQKKSSVYVELPKTDKITEPPSAQIPPRDVPPITDMNAGQPSGISHAKTAETREEFGLGEYEKTKKTDAELEKEADELMKKGFNLESFVKKIEDGHVPSDAEYTALKRVKASLEEKIRVEGASDEALDLLSRFVKATDISGSFEGRSFRARKGLEFPDDSIESFFQTERETNLDAPLTEAQKKTVQKEHEEISQAQKAYEEKIAALEAENAKLKAEAEIKKSAGKSTRQKRDYAGERKQIIDDIREKLRKARGETSATVLPYAKELIAIAPDVAKLVKNLVEQGVTKLEDVVLKIHEVLKDEIKGITPKDVQDIIAGNYNEKKPTRNEAAAQLYDLKYQAKLIDKLDKLESGEAPKSEKQKIKRNQEIEKLRKQVKEHDITRLEDFKSNLKAQIAKIENDLKTGNFEKVEKKPPIKLDKEAQELQDKLIKVKLDREVRLLKQAYQNRSMYEKARDKALDILNVPRTIMASMDYSGLLRQGIIAATGHPRTALKSLPFMFKASFSQKVFDRWFFELKNDPRYEVMKEAGLSVSDPHSPFLTAKEEAFMNNTAEKIPIIGKMIKASERAYVGVLNKMRVDLFNRFAERYEQQGRTMENSKKLYEDLAKFINNATGRGNLGKLEQYAPMLNTVFFSPRLIASRINLLNPVYYAKLSPEVRKIAIQDLLKFVGVGLTVLGLFRAGGMQVEDDPRSADFGKIRDGNTRWDIWGGFQPYIRVITQMVTGQRKSTTSGNITKLDGKGAFATDRSDVIKTFFRGKLAPVPSMTVNFLAGTNIVGEKVTFQNQAEQNLTPLLYTGIKDAMRDQGVKALFTVGVPSVFGIGTQTYEPRKKEISHNDEKVKLTREQSKEHQKILNEKIADYTEKLLKTDQYKKADSDKKQKLRDMVIRAAGDETDDEIKKKYPDQFPRQTNEKLREKALEDAQIKRLKRDLGINP